MTVRPGSALTFASLRRTGSEPRARAMAEGREWFRIVNRRSGSTSYAEVYIYDEIGFYGVTAGQFVAELGELDVDEIDLHINSPGGEVWDGIAIYNALVTHRATVTAYVDGIAASAASVVVMAGDTRIMAQGSQLMIHDAWGVCVGPAADMHAMGQRLDAESDNIARMYQKRSGGTVASWRKAMLDETWYSAEEAVAAGLADKVAAMPAPSPEGRWDMSVYGYRYEGRSKAPTPAMPAGVHASTTGEPPTVPPTAPEPVPAPQPPPAPPEPPAAPDTPIPDVEPEEDGALPDLDGASLGEALSEVFNGPPVTIDPDTFREALRMTYFNAPAPTESASTPEASEPTPAELAAAGNVANALREALTS